MVRLQGGKQTNREMVLNIFFLMFSKRTDVGCFRKLIFLTKSSLALHIRPHAYTGISSAKCDGAHLKSLP